MGYFHATSSEKRPSDYLIFNNVQTPLPLPFFPPSTGFDSTPSSRRRRGITVLRRRREHALTRLEKEKPSFERFSSEEIGGNVHEIGCGRRVYRRFEQRARRRIADNERTIKKENERERVGIYHRSRGANVRVRFTFFVVFVFKEEEERRRRRERERRGETTNEKKEMRKRKKKKKKKKNQTLHRLRRYCSRSRTRASIDLKDGGRTSFVSRNTFDSTT